MKITVGDDTQQAGTIILLNGPTSTGKTSMAKAVQNQFAEPYLHLGADLFVFEICPRPYFLGERGAKGISLVPVIGSDPALIAFQCGPFGQKLLSTMHQTVALLATLGHNVVVDHCITEPAWLRECVALWQSLRVVFVGVSCPLAIIEQRLAARPDRSLNALPLARWQAQQVQRHGIYDLELDTSALSPAECATAIQHYLAEGPLPSAFQQLAITV